MPTKQRVPMVFPSGAEFRPSTVLVESCFLWFKPVESSSNGSLCLEAAGEDSRARAQQQHRAEGWSQVSCRSSNLESPSDPYKKWLVITQNNGVMDPFLKMETPGRAFFTGAGRKVRHLQLKPVDPQDCQCQGADVTVAALLVIPIIGSLKFADEEHGPL